MKARIGATVAWLLLGGPAWAAYNLADFAFHQQPGAQVPMDLPLRDEAGHPVRLRDVNHGRPTILLLGYLHCPNLCGLEREDLFHALRLSGLRPTQYSLVVLSIDPAETSADAVAAKRGDLTRHALPGADAAWHYLTGPAGSLAQIAQTVGFPYRYDPALGQFLHPAGLVFLDGAGEVSGYLLGVGYSPGDLAQGVRRAGEGVIGNTASPVLLLCFHFDPNTGRYTLAITKVLRLAGLITVLALAGMIGLALRHERTR